MVPSTVSRQNRVGVLGLAGGGRVGDGQREQREVGCRVRRAMNMAPTGTPGAPGDLASCSVPAAEGTRPATGHLMGAGSAGQQDEGGRGHSQVGAPAVTRAPG